MLNALLLSSVLAPCWQKWDLEYKMKLKEVKKQKIVNINENIQIRELKLQKIGNTS